MVIKIPYNGCDICRRWEKLFIDPHGLFVECKYCSLIRFHEHLIDLYRIMLTFMAIWHFSSGKLVIFYWPVTRHLLRTTGDVNVSVWITRDLRKLNTDKKGSDQTWNQFTTVILMTPNCSLLWLFVHFHQHDFSGKKWITSNINK